MNLESKLECPVCYETMRQAVVVTQCGHSFCEDCVKGWIIKDPTCPNCRKAISAKDLMPNFSIREIVGQTAKKIVGVVSGEEAALCKEFASVTVSRQTAASDAEAALCRKVEIVPEVTTTSSHFSLHLTFAIIERIAYLYNEPAITLHVWRSLSLSEAQKAVTQFLNQKQRSRYLREILYTAGECNLANHPALVNKSLSFKGEWVKDPGRVEVLRLYNEMEKQSAFSTLLVVLETSGLSQDIYGFEQYIRQFPDPDSAREAILSIFDSEDVSLQAFRLSSKLKPFSVRKAAAAAAAVEITDDQKKQFQNVFQKLHTLPVLALEQCFFAITGVAPTSGPIGFQLKRKGAFNETTCRALLQWLQMYHKDAEVTTLLGAYAATWAIMH